MKRLIFVVVVMLSACGLLNVNAADQFHGPELYEATGPVKEIKLKSDNPLAVKKKVGFTADGKINKSLMTYNQSGYPIGYGTQFGSRQITFDISYNEKNLIDTITLVATMGGFIDVSFINIYDESGKLIGRRSHKNNKDGNEASVLEYVFSDVVNDDYGNWVSRNVTQTVTKPGSEPKTENYTETRSIKYYPATGKK